MHPSRDAYEFFWGELTAATGLLQPTRVNIKLQVASADFDVVIFSRPFFCMYIYTTYQFLLLLFFCHKVVDPINRFIQKY